MPVVQADPDHPTMKELDKVQIHPNLSDHKVHIGAQLRPDLYDKLINFLKKHHDCFAWWWLVTHRHDKDPSRGDDSPTPGRPRLASCEAEETQVCSRAYGVINEEV